MKDRAHICRRISGYPDTLIKKVLVSWKTDNSKPYCKCVKVVICNNWHVSSWFQRKCAISLATVVLNVHIYGKCHNRMPNYKKVSLTVWSGDRLWGKTIIETTIQYWAYYRYESSRGRLNKKLVFVENWVFTYFWMELSKTK